MQRSLTLSISKIWHHWTLVMVAHHNRTRRGRRSETFLLISCRISSNTQSTRYPREVEGITDTRSPSVHIGSPLFSLAAGCLEHTSALDRYRHTGYPESCSIYGFHSSNLSRELCGPSFTINHSSFGQICSSLTRRRRKALYTLPSTISLYKISTASATLSYDFHRLHMLGYATPFSSTVFKRSSSSYFLGQVSGLRLSSQKVTSHCRGTLLRP